MVATDDVFSTIYAVRSKEQLSFKYILQHSINTPSKNVCGVARDYYGPIKT
jgi:hypothetical protein